MSKIYKWASVKFSQKFAGYLATIFSIALIIMLAHWVKNTNTKEKYFGGLKAKDSVHLASWHAVLMSIALSVALINAILSYRQLPFGHTINKIIHGSLHTVALICIILGIRSIVRFHNYFVLSNLSSLHSWLGLTALALFGQNYILGFLHFAIPALPLSLKKNYKPFHRFLGIMTMFLGVIAMETGIIQKNGSFGCGHTITEIDSNPASGYSDIPEGCRLSSGIGLVLVVIAILVAYAIWDTRTSNPSDYENSEVQVEMITNQIQPKENDGVVTDF